MPTLKNKLYDVIYDSSIDSSVSSYIYSAVVALLESYGIDLNKRDNTKPNPPPPKEPKIQIVKEGDLKENDNTKRKQKI